MNIIGEFPVQNSEDAKHWVATVNFLRTITKMYFGKEQALKGNPPPIMHLSGYGDHMFSKVPVVVNTFNVELRPGIDYISTKQNTGTGTDRTEIAGFDRSATRRLTDLGTHTVKHISAGDTDLQQGVDQELLTEEICTRRVNGKGDEDRIHLMAKYSSTSPYFNTPQNEVNLETFVPRTTHGGGRRPELHHREDLRIQTRPVGL